MCWMVVTALTSTTIKKKEGKQQQKNNNKNNKNNNKNNNINNTRMCDSDQHNKQREGLEELTVVQKLPLSSE